MILVYLTKKKYNVKYTSSNNVECAGLCLSIENCHAFYWVDSECKLISPPSTTFEISTDNGMMTICLDHQNWNPLEVYADNSNIPPMCPSKVMQNFT